MGLHRSTAARILRELESSRYVTRGPDKEYAVVAERVRALAPADGEHSDWIDMVNPILSHVRDRYCEATNFSVPAEGAMVYMSYFASPEVVAVREGPGSVRPMYCSAIGKAYLAALDPEALDTYLSRLRYEGGTERAPSGSLELQDQIVSVQSRGYAFDLQETLKGVVCVATDVRVGGVVMGAAGISAPADRMSEDRIRESGEYLRSAFRELAQQTELTQ